MRALAALAALALAGPLAPQVHADVIAASRGGFSLRIVTHTRASPTLAYRAFTEIANWWHPDHTYSGDAANLSLEMTPGGGFTERTAEGLFVRHLQVVYARPNREIRLLGGLGPLQPMGLDGAMTVTFEPAASGARVVTLYNVSGFSETGLENLAPVVDRVQTEQMQRHAAYADSLAGRQ